MKFQSAALILATATAASAQDAPLSGPFALTIKSKNATVNGSYLYACHSGAAIESLCVATGPLPTTLSQSEEFYFAASSYQYPNTTYELGTLNFLLPVNEGNATVNVTEPMSFIYTPTSNVAVPLLEPSNGLTIGFDAKDRLFVPEYYDETKFTTGGYPTYLETPKPKYQWYLCDTITGGYYYNTLAWVTSGKPTNPTCKSVEAVVKVDV